ncbi:hypothetical protein [Variovorax boronicumulans]|jgi:hypothetical protein
MRRIEPLPVHDGNGCAAARYRCAFSCRISEALGLHGTIAAGAEAARSIVRAQDDRDA